eukprot:6190676-Pleurochrysis_carterae.AAC.1
MPLVGGADRNGTASGNPTYLRFNHLYRASPIGRGIYIALSDQSQTVYWAWQAPIPYCHDPAIYCSASPLIVQLAVAATYGRTSGEGNVWCGNLVIITNKASYTPSTRLHREDRNREPSGSRCRHALGFNSTRTNKEMRNGA